jgi:predicted nucleic acid-binding Zn ribbon protein
VNPQPVDNGSGAENGDVEGGGSKGSGFDLARAALAAARARGRDGGAGWSGNRRRNTNSGQRSGSGPDERDPQLLSSAIPRMIEDRGWSVPAAVGGVMGRWGEIVGSHIAAHCKPVEFNDGILTVRTDSDAWATELRMMAPQLLAKLNAELGTSRAAHGGHEAAGAIAILKVVGPGGR